MTAKRPWPVTAIAAVLVLHLCFTFYVAINALWPPDSAREIGRFIGFAVASVVMGGLLVRGVLLMNRWPYVFFAVGLAWWAWRLARSGFALPPTAIYSIPLLVLILAVGGLYWRRMTWGLGRRPDTSEPPS